MFTIKHIPFFKISNPPNIYDLRRAKEKAKKRTSHKTFQRWDVENVERKQLLNAYGSFETVYISIDELKRKKTNNLVRITYPGISKLGTDKEKVKKYAGSPQFAFGGYYGSDKLFLMDDIFEWSHHRISWSQIRTAESIIKALSLE